jgi:formylglycine-generating enzyme required for sulfatase activity
MLGNVREWCLDSYANYLPGAASDPTGPKVFPSQAIHVSRGGDIGSSLIDCTPSRRFPGETDNSKAGFRVAFIAD